MSARQTNRLTGVKLASDPDSLSQILTTSHAEMGQGGGGGGGGCVGEVRQAGWLP